MKDLPVQQFVSQPHIERIDLFPLSRAHRLEQRSMDALVGSDTGTMEIFDEPETEAENDGR